MALFLIAFVWLAGIVLVVSLCAAAARADRMAERVLGPASSDERATAADLYPTRARQVLGTTKEAPVTCATCRGLNGGEVSDDGHRIA